MSNEGRYGVMWLSIVILGLAWLWRFNGRMVERHGMEFECWLRLMLRMGIGLAFELVIADGKSRVITAGCVNVDRRMKQPRRRQSKRILRVHA